MSEENKEQQKQPQNNSRRDFLKNAGLTIGGLAVGGGIVGSLVNPKKDSTSNKHEHGASTTSENHNKALMYFTKEQLQTVEAAAEQIFPKTEVGPGAKELLVAYYIDHQLAGPFGLNTKEYMSGPFYYGEAVPEQGYQTHLNRQRIFDLGIVALNNEAKSRFDAKFHGLEEEQQIEILKDFEADKVKMNGAVTSSYFFQLLRKVTIEGAYADPMYGGNKDMAGWKMKNFPGHQMNMKEAVASEKFVKLKPQSLTSQHQH